MAAKTFLDSKDLEQAKSLLKALHFVEQAASQAQAIEGFLEEKLFKKLSEIDGWNEAKPIALGSLARQEICAKSDIDLLFVGQAAGVSHWMGETQKMGLRVRTRVPENLMDWTQGVEPFDVLALLTARPLVEGVEEELIQQQKQALQTWQKEILKTVKQEREGRRKRLDGIASYLEPNIKYGTGGLRDVEQALALHRLSSAHFSKEDSYAVDVLSAIKAELLLIRQWLHIKGGGDILSAQEQLELWQPYGFPSHRDFMRHLQLQLGRASFYADWLVEKAQLRKQQPPTPPRSLDHALELLHKTPNILTQYRVRRHIQKLNQKLKPKQRGQLLKKAIGKKRSDDFLIALHRTRFLEKMIPDFKLVRGLVQHDHYHRFTVDAHLLQTLREVARSEKHPKVLDNLEKVAKRLKPQDWWTLKLTALFHDLAKGREGDHSTEGAKLVQRVFKEWGFPVNLTEDVSWLVLNHLIYSTAAFRRNPKEKSTWQMLFDRGVTGRRLDLLTVFTAIDIRATNPEAWTPWKSQLMADLNTQLHSPGAVKMQGLLAKVGKQQELKNILLKLDPLVVENISSQVLIKDLNRIRRIQDDQKPLVIRDRKGGVWVRFHSRLDRPGLFRNYVEKLYRWSLPVQMSSVMSLEGVGVYDWFLLKTKKSTSQIASWLAKETSTNIEVPKVRFLSIEVLSEDEKNWILSFRGKDQKGLLLAAAGSLYDLGLSIQWAQVHTWGQQVDDVFCVTKGNDIGQVLQALMERFVT